MPKCKKVVRQGRAKVAKMLEARLAKRKRQNIDVTPTTSKHAQQNYVDTRLKDNQSDAQPPLMVIFNVQPMEKSNTDLQEDFAGNLTVTKITEETNKNFEEVNTSNTAESSNDSNEYYEVVIKTEVTSDEEAPSTGTKRRTSELNEVDPHVLEWADKLSNLSTQQRMLATKMISVVLHRAELGILHEDLLKNNV
ncbi:uncharacterized protein LOC126969847 isoform X1 [Leptidea sinapis]|uniref:uncharacterized protein LOC126969847 isoform X1 n=1 Tax=Leptidea sinapis TaxID=189913 RepID=UPI0021C453E5|nr:uncharacterized protein LOC126969847 isoform X1 [Leptidea sinapis]